MPRVPGSNAFTSKTVDEVRQAGNVMPLPGGSIHLPEVFGFCRGVERALDMLDAAVEAQAAGGKRLFLLGEIIHNPWVNHYFAQRGVRRLTEDQREHLEDFIGPGDCAIIPAFGVPPPIERRLRAIGCEIVDTSCGDVRRLWKWAEHAAGQGFGVLIFGRATHDETVVTKSRLAEAGGSYLVAGDLRQVRQVGELIAGDRPAGELGELFGPDAANAGSLEPFQRLAQVSQTTMLYDDTMEVRRILTEAFSRRFGPEQLPHRLLLQPTVCRATQARQTAAVTLCQSRLDLVVVVGGFGSSNTRHLYELARKYSPAYFIESAQAIRSADALETADIATHEPIVVRDWLPPKRPLRVGILAGASSPECVIGEVLRRLAEFLST